MYCVFIDFEKAFDSVWRIGLLNKILLNNIDGKCFDVISQLYNSINQGFFQIVHTLNYSHVQ